MPEIFQELNASLSSDITKMRKDIQAAYVRLTADDRESLDFQRLLIIRRLLGAAQRLACQTSGDRTEEAEETYDLADFIDRTGDLCEELAKDLEWE